MTSKTENKYSDNTDVLYDVNYLLNCVEQHADKFPVPSHMRQMVERLRPVLNEALGEPKG